MNDYEVLNAFKVIKKAAEELGTKVTTSMGTVQDYNPCAELVSAVLDDDEDYREFETFALELPGMEYMVKYPCSCDFHSGAPDELMSVIVHLNDRVKMPREDIADWLESIHDPTGINGPNLNFGTGA